MYITVSIRTIDGSRRQFCYKFREQRRARRTRSTADVENNSSRGTMRTGELGFLSRPLYYVDSLDENATWAHVKSDRRKRIKSVESVSLGARPSSACSSLLSNHPLENRTRACRRTITGGERKRKRERERKKKEPSHFSRMWFKSSHKRRRCAELQAACSSVGR